ncbi:restriction system-associated AAA family ATPase [Agrobacterium cavarae]|uniref:restriction system-associated AAA family ATPase n=1 Tax=Agrobacterium cavarae TaxID=2528239 RepID=UPI0028AC5A88|nr:restriction system-associated AAA family ATPase [Agrobacterium cavarae]
MKLLRLKITDPVGFRSLSPGFEHHFRTEWSLQDELAQPEGFAPFICAGPNGSGKSNLLEVLAAIFFQLEILRVRRSFLPEVLQDEALNFSPAAFELDYMIRVSPEYRRPGGSIWATVSIVKGMTEAISIQWLNQHEFEVDADTNESLAEIIFPEYVLGYSSGENEILSLPFFKMRFVQFDEYWNALSQQLTYPGHPETRLAFLDSGFSQAIFLCNLLFQDDEILQPFREDIGINQLNEFRIILRRSVLLEPDQISAFAVEDEQQAQSIDEIINQNPALQAEADAYGVTRYRVNLLQLLEGSDKSSLIVSALKRCATLYYVDESTDTLILDYWVNDATKEAFHENFGGSARTLFQAFQVLLTLNLYSVTSSLKADLYKSTSHYVSETVPVLASDQRIMRFKYVRFRKQGAAEPMMLKELSDGEHQLLHSLGLCLLFRDTNSLILLDEPETHFNPSWRANFVSRLRQCLPGNKDVEQEMLITTHSPFLISDSKPEKVLVFVKDQQRGDIRISHPNYNTLGASINKITMNTFGKRETIGGHAQALLDEMRARFERGEEDKDALVAEIQQQLGESVEKMLLVKAILDRTQDSKGEEQR